MRFHSYPQLYHDQIIISLMLHILLPKTALMMVLLCLILFRAPLGDRWREQMPQPHSLSYLISCHSSHQLNPTVIQIAKLPVDVLHSLSSHGKKKCGEWRVDLGGCGDKGQWVKRSYQAHALRYKVLKAKWTNTWSLHLLFHLFQVLDKMSPLW